MHDSSALGYCPEHRKFLYADRKTARKAAKGHTSHMNAYRCPLNTMLWHIGELNRDVIHGHVDRDTFYRQAA